MFCVFDAVHTLAVKLTPNKDRPVDCDVCTYIIHDRVCIRTDRPRKIGLKMTHPSHAIVRAALVS